MMRCIFLLGLMLCLLPSADAIPAWMKDMTPVERANRTLEALMYYDWRQNTSDPQIPGFWFACGQIGGLGNASWSGCHCKNTTYCENCHRWLDGLGIDALATYGVYTGDMTYNWVPKQLWSHTPYRSTWDHPCNYMDDFAWFLLGYLRSYEWLKDEKWLQEAEKVFWLIVREGEDEYCGGILWCNCMYAKNSITMMQMLEGGARLATYRPEDKRYMAATMKLWNWIMRFNRGRGLANEKGVINSGASPRGYINPDHPEGCCNETSSFTPNATQKKKGYIKLGPCQGDIPGEYGYTYNQGLFLTATGYLYKLTGEAKYLTLLEHSLAGILDAYTDQHGVIKEDPPVSYPSYVDQCVEGQDPGGDWYSFKGIFALRLGMLLELRLPLQNSTKTRIMRTLRASADSLWTARSSLPPFGKNDVCNAHKKVTEKMKTLPKFQWQWGSPPPPPATPADHSAFFVHWHVGCEGAPIATPVVQNQDQCQALCVNNSKCLEYSYSYTPPGCALYGAQDNHRCQKRDQNQVVGIKHLKGSCKAHCSTIPTPPDSFISCQCDHGCALRHDCCDDYTTYCNGNTSTCAGLCGTAKSVSVPGGGYCWCDSDTSMTASTGSTPPLLLANGVCGDYENQCNGGGQQGFLCQDARSQISAFSLFTANLMVDQVEANTLSRISSTFLDTQ